MSDVLRDEIALPTGIEGREARMLRDQSASRCALSRLEARASLKGPALAVRERVTILRCERPARSAWDLIEAANARLAKLGAALESPAIRTMPPEAAATASLQHGVKHLRWLTSFGHGHLNRQDDCCSD